MLALQNKLGKLGFSANNRVVVVGRLGSGKSSVISAVLGYDLLPISLDVYRRFGNCPIQLRLIDTPGAVEPYFTLEHLAHKRFTQPEEVRTAIEAFQDVIRRSNPTRVEINVISISVHIDGCVQMTLLELPGWYSGFADSMRTEDIEMHKLASKHMMQPDTIILCVIGANCDVTTSNHLALAHQLDPKHQRTIVVLTKPDLIDRGVSIRGIIYGHEIPLRLGYIVMHGRSKADHSEIRMDPATAFHRERRFFRDHHEFRSMPGRYFGTEVLAERIIKVCLLRSFMVDATLLDRNIQARQDMIADILSSLFDSVAMIICSSLNYLIKAIGFTSLLMTSSSNRPRRRAAIKEIASNEKLNWRLHLKELVDIQRELRRYKQLGFRSSMMHDFSRC